MQETLILLVMGVLIVVAAWALRRPVPGSGLPTSADGEARRKHSWWDWSAIRDRASGGGWGGFGGGWGGCGGGGAGCGAGGGCCGGSGCGGGGGCGGC